MKAMTMIIIACLTGVFVMAAGCTGTSGSAPAPTPAATATTAPVGSDPWSGTWNTGASTPVAYQTIGVLTMSQTGSSVTGTFSNQDRGKGTITGSVTGNVLSGTWTMSYPGESDSGSFKFVMSDDNNSFTGTWVSATDKANTLSTTSDFWNGMRG